MKADLVIFGTGGFAREVHQVVEDLVASGENLSFLGFIDDNRDRWGTTIHDHPVLGGTDWLADHAAVSVAIGVGNPAVRRKIAARVGQLGCRFPALVHPLAWKGNRVSVGAGSIICAGTLITTDISIGDHVILNLDCTVGHDTTIGDFVTAAPSVNISGSVRIGEGCDLGTGSVIIQGIEIGRWSVLGAGAVLVAALPANVTAVGIPAKVIKERPDGWHES